MWDFLISSVAEKDIASSAFWYEKQRSGLGQEFIAAIETVFQVLPKDPERIRIYYHSQSVRRILAHRFPYHIYYYIEGNTVRVFAVIHVARHQQYWQHRL